MQISQFTLQNLKKYQEDRSFVTEMNDQILVRVFDGHGGAWTSEHAVNRTPKIFKRLSKAIKKDPDKTLTKIISTLVAETNDHHSGSTVCIVWVCNNIAHVAVLGDSSAIIRTENQEIRQSPEHNVRSNAKEALEAEARGGRIAVNGYLFDKWRIDGPGLQMSRALGDKELGRVLNREPEIFHIPLNDDSWILVCSDGFLDPSHQDSTFLEEIVDSIENRNLSAKELVEEAASMHVSNGIMKKARRGDNSTAILIRMK
jgi:serine/threonine protein phosphatase PrpC